MMSNNSSRDPGSKVITPQPIKSNRSPLAVIIVAALVLLILTTGMMVGAAAGYQTGLKQQQTLNSANFDRLLQQQAELGLLDVQEGRLEIARQRFEFILAANPDYPGVAEQMAAILAILQATATPTITDIPTPTVTLTPTPDLRPIQDRLAHIIELMAAGSWDSAIDALVGLRKDDPTFKATRVDGLLYAALLQRGVEKIYQTHNLAGGIYDLSLAENFGPLDLKAEVARNLARLYLIGSGFWEAYPEQAVYFFSQVASAAPYLSDASGWTARERYRGALIQYGDQFGRAGDWCTALEQYRLAASIRSDSSLESIMQKASDACSPAVTPNEDIATQTPSPTIPTDTPTPVVIVPTDTPVPTTPPLPTDTLPPTPTDEPPTPTDEPPTPTDEPPPPPTDTSVPPGTNWAYP